MSRSSRGARRSVVLFDLDGTLVDREPLAAHALFEVCAAAGWMLEPEALGRFRGWAWQDVHRELGIEDRTGWTEPRFVDLVVSRCETLLAEGYPVPVLPGAIDLVDALAARGVPLGLVTGSSRREVVATLRPLGLLDRFRAVVAAEDYRRGKPEPDCYSKALQAMGGAARRSVAVEDSGVGVAAARAAGLQVVGTRAANPDGLGSAREELSAADLVVETLAHEGLLSWVEARLAE